MKLELLTNEFKTGTILQSSHFNNLRDYPKTYLEAKYKNYSDGIIEGFNIETNENKVILTPGIIKLEGQIRFLRDEIVISPEKEEKYILVIDKDYVIKFESLKYKDYRFKFGYLHFTGGKIYCSQEDLLPEMETNFLDLRFCKKSSIYNSIPLNKYLETFGKKMLQKKNIERNVVDYLFAINCINHTVTYHYIDYYLKIKEYLVDKTKDNVKSKFNMNYIEKPEVIIDNLNIILTQD